MLNKIDGVNIFSSTEISEMINQNKYLINELDNNIIAKELFNAIQNIDTDSIEQKANNIEKNINIDIENIIICGIGGSSLGIKAFVNAAKDDLRLKRKCFFLENVDPVSIIKVFKSIDLKKSLFIFISKSGGTIETILQTEYTINILIENNLLPQNHCIAITDITKENDLNKLSKNYNIQTISWHGNIGGRFSALTISTLLPLHLFGLNIKMIAKAGKETNAENGLHGAVASNILWKKNHDVTVIMPYSDQLIDFAAWYRQLWAESVGKDGFGSVPEYSIGTIDQHSMLQMYLGGKKNKFFTIIKIDSKNSEFENNQSQKLQVYSKNSSLLSKNGNVNFSQIFKGAADATTSSMIKEGCPVRTITIPTVNEYYIAKLMIEFFYETILAVELANKYFNYNISAFGQPNVEKSKTNFINAISVV